MMERTSISGNSLLAISSEEKILNNSPTLKDPLKKHSCSSLMPHIQVYGGSSMLSFAYRWMRPENAGLVSGIDRDTRVLYQVLFCIWWTLLSILHYINICDGVVCSVAILEMGLGHFLCKLWRSIFCFNDVAPYQQSNKFKNSHYAKPDWTI